MTSLIVAGDISAALVRRYLGDLVKSRTEKKQRIRDRLWILGPGPRGSPVSIVPLSVLILFFFPGSPQASSSPGTAKLDVLRTCAPRYSHKLGCSQSSWRAGRTQIRDRTCPILIRLPRLMLPFLLGALADLARWGLRDPFKTPFREYTCATRLSLLLRPPYLVDSVSIFLLSSSQDVCCPLFSSYM